MKDLYVIEGFLNRERVLELFGVLESGVFLEEAIRILFFRDV